MIESGHPRAADRAPRPLLLAVRRLGRERRLTGQAGGLQSVYSSELAVRPIYASSMGRLRCGVLRGSRRARLRPPGAGECGDEPHRCVQLVLGQRTQIRWAANQRLGPGPRATAPSPRPRHASRVAAARVLAAANQLINHAAGAGRSLRAGGRRRLDRGRAPAPPTRSPSSPSTAASCACSRPSDADHGCSSSRPPTAGTRAARRLRRRAGGARRRRPLERALRRRHLGDVADARRCKPRQPGRRRPTSSATCRHWWQSSLRPS